MGVINNNKLGIDLPVFETLRDSPGGNSSAISTTCTALNPIMHINFGRYIYYLNAATSFWRYDTWTDTHVQLSSPPITPSTFSTMRFAMSAGVEGRVLAATANTIQIPAYYGLSIRGYDITIVSGTGAGQRRTITNVSDAILEDIVVASAVSNTLGALSVTDSTKNWPVNRWAGFQARVINNTGVGQVRRILTNSINQLVFGDSALAPYDLFCNPAVFSPAIVSTPGSQAILNIESHNITIDSPWTITPDSTSRYKVEGGGLMLVSSAAATPFYTFQQYDIATDTWYIRSAVTNNVAVVGTGGSVERTGDQATIWDRGIPTAPGTLNTITDSTKSWTINQWATSSFNVSSSYYIRIWSGQGEGQQSKIISNTATTLTFESMSVAPTTSSQYFIDGFDAGKATAGSSLSLTDSSKNWPDNRWKNYAVRIISGSGNGQLFPIISNNSSSLNFYTSSSVALDSTSVYNITADPDKLYLTLGNNAAINILNLNDDLLTYGRREDSGVARNAFVRFGSEKHIAIASVSNVGTTATVTTALTHNYRVGQSVTVRGATDANFNGTFTIATVPTTTTFTYVMGGTPASTTLVGSQTTSTLCDFSKNWATNQWAGYMVYCTTSAMTAASGLVSGQALIIASNTANTLTFRNPAVAPTNGVSRYIITKIDAIGNMFSGFASGTQSTTTLVDVNVAFTGSASISGNTLNVTSVTNGYLGIGSLITGSGILTGSFITAFGPNTFGGTGSYTISVSQSFVLGPVSSSGWVTNFFAGRRVKILGGQGQSQEPIIASNTNNTLTFAALTTAPGNVSSSYSILQHAIRGTSAESQWVQDATDPILRGRRIYMPRGGGLNTIDFIDIPSDKVDTIVTSPQTETLTTGTMWAYDGENRIYFTKDTTMRFYYLDTDTNQIHGAGFAPFGTGVAIIGNRMEIFTTPDGLKYLWFVKHTSANVMRALIYY